MAVTPVAVLAMVSVAGIAFLLRFLVALRQEDRRPAHVVRIVSHPLDFPSAPPHQARWETRRAIPLNFPVPYSQSAAAAGQQQRAGQH
jgi:hypothetical protein